jgi:ABC-type multidrug transport system fused ATPase/permease subunit
MDKIAVFDQGKIVEHDTPSSLLNNEHSVFRKLWNMQPNGFLINIGKERHV